MKRMTLILWLYLAVGGAVLFLYGGSVLRGWQLRSAAAARLPADVRTSPGGYRSFHFWHSGYQGGK